jgi:hypothetical protein
MLTRILLVTMLMIAIPPLVPGQAKSKNTTKKGGDEQAVRQELNDLVAALNTTNIKELDRIWADGYTFVSDSGVLTAKPQRLASFKSGEIKYDSISIDDVRIHVFGDTAICTFHVISKFAPGVKSVGGKFMTTATFVKSKGRWAEVAAQSTRIVE